MWNLLKYCFCFIFWYLSHFSHVGSWLPTRDETHISCIRRCSLNHRTARGVSPLFL